MALRWPRPPDRERRHRLVVVVGLMLLFSIPSRPEAHEIPFDVTVRSFVKPEGERLLLLVRVPLASMRDTEFPLYGPGYLDLEGTEPLLADAARLWIADYVQLYEEGSTLPRPEVVATRISLPSDRSFGTWEEARAHMDAPRLGPDTDLVLEQALLDVLLETPIGSEGSRFSIEPGWTHLGVRTVTVLHFVLPGGGERIYTFSGDPGLVRLDPRWHQAVLRFIGAGFLHILDGIDHLLFLLCLVIPVRRVRTLVAVVTSFTVAHSITLITSAMGFAPDTLWFPALVETLIALSIVYMAFENIVGTGLGHRWSVAFAFGLVHGFGFSFFLRDTLQYAGAHLLTSLVSFNVGVELGQLFVLLLVVPALAALFRWVVPERMGVILISALVAHTAWHWSGERGTELLLYQFAWPGLTAAFLASLMRWALLLILVGAVGGSLGWLFKRWGARAEGAGSPQAGS